MKKKKKKERKAIEIQKSSSYAGRACRNLERIWKNRPTKLKNFNDSTSLEIHLSPLPPSLQSQRDLTKPNLISKRYLKRKRMILKPKLSA